MRRGSGLRIWLAASMCNNDAGSGEKHTKTHGLSLPETIYSQLYCSSNFLVSAIVRVGRQRGRNKKFTISGCRMLVQSSIYSLKMSNLFQLVFEVCMISTSANKLKQTKHVPVEI